MSLVTQPDETLLRQTREEENFSRLPYKDSRGILTIAIGRCIDPLIKGAGISEPEAMFMLGNDLRGALAYAAQFPWWEALDPVRKRVIAQMLFQLGLPHFLEFKDLQMALTMGYFQRASEAMLDSKWAHETPERVKRLANRMASGSEELPPNASVPTT